MGYLLWGFTNQHGDSSWDVLGFKRFLTDNSME